MHGTLAATARLTRRVIRPNADPGVAGVRAALREANVRAVHLPRPRFLALLRGAKAIVGNSSAGLIEAAVLRTPAVNVGPRQNGREKPGNVIDCGYGRRHVAAALRRAVALDLTRLRPPYGRPGVGRRIAAHLAQVDLSRVPLRKRNTY